MKLLFILKERFYSSSKSSYGLINSSLHLIKYLEQFNTECKVTTVIDYNSIDKEVFDFKPDIVIIEALWVSAEKLKELSSIKRYENIKWIVRVHSDMGFLSSETLAVKYINDYIELNNDNIIVSLNNKKFVEHLSDSMNYNFLYLPNIINIKDKNYEKSIETNIINIGCFGSLRLLKNQCFQAMCAIKAANKLNKILKFHITADIDADADKNPVLKNLKELFKNTKHELIVHSWLENEDFHKLIKQMDLGLQISYTETFNIVTADFINNDKLIVVGETIDWIPSILKTSTIDYKKAMNKIIFAYKYRNSGFIKSLMRKNLDKYNKIAEKEWIKLIINDII